MSDVVTECLEAGCPAIQLRDKEASASELHRQALELRELTRSRGALLFINDRLDVALAVGADGVHLGPDDIPVDAVRRHVGHHFLIGYSTDDPQLGLPRRGRCLRNELEAGTRGGGSGSGQGG
jgi:thiamine-phosphate pyrophosphorylase